MNLNIPTQCPGEYPGVAEMSMNLDRLRRAHVTPCDHALAYLLVAIMHNAHKDQYIYGGPAPVIKFRRDKRGFKRSWARSKPNGMKRLCLPHEDLIYNPITCRNPNGYLRVGVVIHEYAHLLTMKSGELHGRAFVIVLDQLLFETETYWKAYSNIIPVLKAAGR